MEFETIEPKPITKQRAKDIKNKMTNNELKQVSTFKMLRYLVVKHKYFLMSTYALIISVLYFIPATPQILQSLFN